MIAYFNFYIFSELVAGWIGVVKTPRMSTCIYDIMIAIIRYYHIIDAVLESVMVYIIQLAVSIYNIYIYDTYSSSIPYGTVGDGCCCCE